MSFLVELFQWPQNSFSMEPQAVITDRLELCISYSWPGSPELGLGMRVVRAVVLGQGSGGLQKPPGAVMVRAHLQTV